MLVRWAGCCCFDLCLNPGKVLVSTIALQGEQPGGREREREREREIGRQLSRPRSVVGSMTEHEHPPHSLLARFSSVCASFDKAGTRVANRLAETSKAFCQLYARRFVEARQHLPIASFYGSDTTPLRTRKRWLAKVGDNLVIRSSRVCNDWLIQRQFLYDSRGAGCHLDRPCIAS